ncbi:MAG: hypothetical protein K9G72_20345 [Rhodobacteraceae bacterium]|nr:hypothetical protein [Paracoccaceae bacterium]
MIAVVNGKADVVNDHCPASIETGFAECIGMAAAAQAGFRRQGALDGMSTKFEATAVAVACHHARSVS